MRFGASRDGHSETPRESHARVFGTNQSAHVMRWKPQPARRRRRRRALDGLRRTSRRAGAETSRSPGPNLRPRRPNPEATRAAMEGCSRTEDELVPSACLLNLTWESCYEQVGRGILRTRRILNGLEPRMFPFTRNFRCGAEEMPPPLKSPNFSTLIPRSRRESRAEPSRAGPKAPVNQ